MTITFKNAKSAIIGYYRSGASIDKIRLMVDLPCVTVERIIDEYNKAERLRVNEKVISKTT